MSQASTARNRNPEDDEVLGKAYDPKIISRTWQYVRPYRGE